MQTNTYKNYVITDNIFRNGISINYCTSKRCCHVGYADFNLLLLLLLKEQTTRRKSFVVPEEV